MNENPLAGYFRKPAIHLALPSKGSFYPEGTLDMPETKELPVYPMTSLDEITYRTPDALFNGSALVDVIKSCIPSIIDPWQMPSIDITAILAAIRIASFSHNMEISTTCPECNEMSDYELNLHDVLDNLHSPDYHNTFDAGDISVTFKPLTYFEMNENNQIQFEEQQLQQMIVKQDDTLPEKERIKLLSDAFKKVSKYTLDTLVKNISNIAVPGAVVDDPEHILAYLQNCERAIYNGIKSHIVSERAKTDLKPLSITCDDCGHKYEQPFTLDMTSFFE